MKLLHLPRRRHQEDGSTAGSPAGLSPLHLDERELAGLRSGPDRNAWYLTLHARCVELVREGAPGQELAAEAAEGIVAQAVVEELRSFLDPALDAAAVAARLAAALRRARTRRLRQRQDFKDALAAFVSTSVDQELAFQYKEIAWTLKGYLGQTLDALDSGDRNLLIDEYGLGRFGIEKSPSAKPHGHHPLAIRQARRHFTQELDALLTAAIQQHDRESSVLVNLRKIVRSPALFGLLASAGRETL